MESMLPPNSTNDMSPERSLSAFLKKVSKWAVEPRKVTNSCLLWMPSELATHQLARNKSAGTNRRYWNDFRVRGSAEINVASFNDGQLLQVHGNDE
jgi:hypothetical protein